MVVDERGKMKEERKPYEFLGLQQIMALVDCEKDEDMLRERYFRVEREV